MRSQLFMAMVFLVMLPAGPAAAQSAPRQPGLNALHDSLRLRPEQEQAWQAFERAVALDPREEERRRETFDRMDALNAPQRMDLSIQLLRSDLQNLERRADAMKSFYALLSPEQKAVFDRETLPPAR